MPTYTLPPNVKQASLTLIPARYREDAVQEAWVAHLSGKNPTRALGAYVQRERRHELRNESLDAILEGCPEE